MRFGIRFLTRALSCGIRKSYSYWWTLLLVVQVSGAGLLAQTWQRVIDYPQLQISLSSQPFEILPMADGGTLALTKDGHMVRFDMDGDTLWTNTLPDSLRNLKDAQLDSNGTVYLLLEMYLLGNRIISLSPTGGLVSNLAIGMEYKDFCVTSSGFLLVSSNFNPDMDTARLLRVNFGGDTLWYQEYQGPFPMGEAYNVIKTTDGGFLASIAESDTTSNRLRILKIDANGVIQWTANTPAMGYESEASGRVLEEPDGSFVLMGKFGNLGAYFIRLDSVGQVVLEKSNLTIWAPRDFAPATDGGYWIVGLNTLTSPGRLYIIKLDHNFQIVWKKFYATSIFGTSGIHIAYSGGDSYTILGTIRKSPNALDPDFSYVIHPDSEGNLDLNLISGQLRHDANGNCAAEADEVGLANWLVSTGVYFTLTDSMGHFEMYTGAGTTPVVVYPPMNYWAICPGFDTLIFAQTGDTAYLEIPAYGLTECPYTQIDVGTNRFRPCFESVVAVQYCNIGTAAADSATALIVLPPEFDFVSATIPVLLQAGDSIWFDLDTLDVGECGNFQLVGLLDCDSTLLGLTICIEARIFPDSICNPGINWSGAEVAVSAQCINNQEVELTIRNIGAAPTTPVLNYLIIEDQVVLLEGQFQLEPDSVLKFTEPANGAFWRISADQEPNFPAPSTPAAWVEGCGTGQGSGYVNNYYFNDGATSVDLDCRVVTGSYDPNDKQAFPEGYGVDHFIEPETELTYLIRFQNTGTDTAFNVILRDTLDPWLDPASVRPAAGSHPYEFAITGTGVMKVWFKQILLPDSNVNEAASHGFFQYRVRMKPDVPLGTQIRNRAAIYFDFNAPIMTNQTFHMIWRDFYTVSIQDVTGVAGNRLIVSPNPFSETTRLTLEPAEPGPYTLRLFDRAGRQMRLEKFEGPEMLFQRNSLVPGLYFFQIEQRGRPVASGKMAVQ